MTAVTSDRDLFGAPSTPQVSAQQLPLPLAWRDTATQVGIIVGAANSDAVRYLSSPDSWPVPAVLLTGPAGSGKTQLGKLFVARSGGDVLDHDMMEDEEAVFHAWNRAQAEHRPVLLISEDNDYLAHVRLPDLRTRLLATPHVIIEAPDAALSCALIERLLADRGLAVTARLAQFVAERVEHRYAAIHAAVAAIDAAAMGSGKILGERLIRDALSDTASDRQLT